MTDIFVLLIFYSTRRLHLLLTGKKWVLNPALAKREGETKRGYRAFYQIRTDNDYCTQPLEPSLHDPYNINSYVLYLYLVHPSNYIST